MRSERHAKILELIAQHNIETQDELAEHLAKAGFKTTQATISRDIRTLKLTKIVTDDGHFKYVAEKTDPKVAMEKYCRILRDGFISMDQAENMLVIRTVAGMAMAVAAAIDELNWCEVVGCIAGDDTIFCAVRSKQEVPVVIDHIWTVVK